MAQKIIISGFSHSGTSIIKSIIGHIEDIEEIIEETDNIAIQTNKKYIVCKYPQIKQEFLEDNYNDYIKIFIIRNPLFVFSSINRRKQHYNLSTYHSIEKYIECIKVFIKYKNNPQKNVYTIKYEDIFDNNYNSLKNIFDNIGFNYNNNIFNNTLYVNRIIKNIEIPDNKPNDDEHIKYRTWQINQKFELSNDISKIYLSNTQKEKIINNPYILEVYPDIKQIYLETK